MRMSLRMSLRCRRVADRVLQLQGVHLSIQYIFLLLHQMKRLWNSTFNIYSFIFIHFHSGNSSQHPNNLQIHHSFIYSVPVRPTMQHNKACTSMSVPFWKVSVWRRKLVSFFSFFFLFFPVLGWFVNYNTGNGSSCSCSCFL